jgi:hypothetical protein
LQDLASARSTEVSVAIDGLAHIATPGLSMDLFADLLPMLNHSKPYVRKKAVLVMYKIFLQYPDALRVAFPRLREKLEDEDICTPLFTSQLMMVSGGLGDGKCNMRTSKEESEELFSLGTSTIQPLDDVK